MKGIKGPPNGTSGRRCGLTLPMFIKHHGCSIGKSVGLSTVNLHFIEQMSPHFEWINFRFFTASTPNVLLGNTPCFSKVTHFEVAADPTFLHSEIIAETRRLRGLTWSPNSRASF